MRAEGLVTFSGIVRSDGKPCTTQEAVDFGWIVAPQGRKPRGWGLDRHEVPLGKNLFLDQGRQLLAYCWSGRSPLSNYFVQKFGVGTGTTAPATTDVALENPIYFDPPTNSIITQAIDGIDFPSAFVARVEFTLGSGDANGYLITEMGLYSGDDTLVARRTNIGVNKTSDFAPTFTWRVRF